MFESRLAYTFNRFWTHNAELRLFLVGVEGGEQGRVDPGVVVPRSVHVVSHEVYEIQKAEQNNEK